jgi:ubiquinol-cytochrome c reductase cytochrome c1 subunit
MKMRPFLLLLFLGLMVLPQGSQAQAHHPLPKQSWSFQSPFGTFDQAARQRGYQVFKEACSACHGVKLLSYRNLGALGFSQAEIKALAATHDVTDGPNDEGQMYQRPARPSDRMYGPYPNDNAARASNNGALPPDLSLIIKARAGGADYVYAILTGYKEAPAGVKVPEGMHYNPYFPGGQIAMAQALHDGLVTYGDGSPSTIHQMARDVVTFLAWAAEPEMEARKQMGLKVLIYLIIFTLLMFALMRRIWARLV